MGWSRRKLLLAVGGAASIGAGAQSYNEAKNRLQEGCQTVQGETDIAIWISENYEDKNQDLLHDLEQYGVESVDEFGNTMSNIVEEELEQTGLEVRYGGVIDGEDWLSYLPDSENRGSLSPRGVYSNFLLGSEEDKSRMIRISEYLGEGDVKGAGESGNRVCGREPDIQHSNRSVVYGADPRDILGSEGLHEVYQVSDGSLPNSRDLNGLTALYHELGHNMGLGHVGSLEIDEEEEEVLVPVMVSGYETGMREFPVEGDWTVKDRTSFNETELSRIKSNLE